MFFKKEDFMIIWGTKTDVKIIGTIVLLTMNCCNVESAKKVLKVRKWFTLFFIKLIPYSTKYYVECVSCGAAYETTKEKLEEASVI